MNPEISIPISEQQLQKIIDGAFTFIESKTQRPIVKTIEQTANATLDAMMPAIYQYLITQGIVTAPSA